jgi:acyl carrier protein
MTDIDIKLKNIVAKQLGISINQITMESKFIDDLGGDSLDTVEMVLAVEDEFEIEITEDQAENMRCLRDVKNYLDQQLRS